MTKISADRSKMEKIKKQFDELTLETMSHIMFKMEFEKIHSSLNLKINL